MALYNRQVQVRVGKPGTEGTEIREIRIAFDIEKVDDPNPNSGKITLYNLSRDVAASFQEQEQVIQVYAGYGEPALIFLGDVTKAQTLEEGTDRITTIESGDGQKAVKEARISKNYGTNTGPGDIIGDMAGKLAEGLGADDPDALKNRAKDKVNSLLPSPDKLTRPRTFTGKAADQLTKLTRANKLDWMIEDGELKIVPRQDTDQETATSLTPDSGLIGSPQKTDKGRLKVKALLQPDLRLRRIVHIQSRAFEGFFLIRKIRHQGDSGWSQEFYTELELTEKT